MEFASIAEKIEASERITEEEALFFFNYPGLLELGRIARKLKEKRYGLKVFFNRNLHLNLTNVCVSGCKFCSYRKSSGEKGAYVLSSEEALRTVEEAIQDGITEVHIVNGLHPELPFAYYLEVVDLIKSKFPHLTIKAFTAVEIDHFTRLTNLSVEKVLRELKRVGVEFLPGGGAEIFSERARKLLGVRKISKERWLEIHRVAHEMGFRTNATLLYGHFETEREAVEHLSALRKLQDETQGFVAFIPLRFQPWKTEINTFPTTCAEDLRIFAVSRIFLDNFPHIKAYWVTAGLKVAQLSLHFGADDIDGTIVKERIMHAAGSPVKEGLSVEEVVGIIKESGLIPVERNTFYDPIRSYAA